MKTQNINVCTVRDLLDLNENNQTKTASQLGVNRGGLRMWMAKGLIDKLLVEIHVDDKKNASFNMINHIRNGRVFHAVTNAEQLTQ